MNFAGLIVLIEMDNMIGAFIAPFITEYKDLLQVKNVPSSILIVGHSSVVASMLVFGSFFIYSYRKSPSHVGCITMKNMAGCVVVFFITWLIFNGIIRMSTKEIDKYQNWGFGGPERAYEEV